MKLALLQGKQMQTILNRWDNCYPAHHTTGTAHTTTPGGRPAGLLGDGPLVGYWGSLGSSLAGRTRLALVFVFVGIIVICFIFFYFLFLSLTLARTFYFPILERTWGDGCNPPFHFAPNLDRTVEQRPNEFLGCSESNGTRVDLFRSCIDPSRSGQRKKR